MYNLHQHHNHNQNQTQEKIKISNDTRLYIIDELVEPYYKRIVKNTIDGRLFWRRTGITLETVSKIMVALGSIMSFSAGYYKDDKLSFISGSISCLSLAFLQLSSFSYKENKKQSDELNILLKKLDLDTVPVLERNSDVVQQQAKTSMYTTTNMNNMTIKKNIQPSECIEYQKEKTIEELKTIEEEVEVEKIDKINKIDKIDKIDKINIEKNQNIQLSEIQTNEENNQEDNHEEQSKTPKSFLDFLRNFKV
jgi:hypothetical protein